MRFEVETGNLRLRSWTLSGKISIVTFPERSSYRDDALAGPSVPRSSVLFRLAGLAIL